MQVLARPGMPSLDKVVGWTAQLVEQGWPLIQVIARAIMDAPGTSWTGPLLIGLFGRD